MIVATDEAELPGLRQLEHRGCQNRVPGLRWLSASEQREIEPHAAGVAALHAPAAGSSSTQRSAGRSPSCAVRAMRSRTGCEVRTADERGDRLVIGHSSGQLTTRRALFCAVGGPTGWPARPAPADRQSGHARREPIPFRRAYLLREETPDLVRGLIYPVPIRGCRS